MTVYVWARDHGDRVMSGIGTSNELGTFSVAWRFKSRSSAKLALLAFRRLDPATKRFLMSGAYLLQGQAPMRPREVFAEN